MSVISPIRRAMAAIAVCGLVLCACERPQQADVGGPFTLIDHTGAQVTDADFRGSPMLIYFGFTYCPDVCPLSLQKLAVALDILGDDAALFQPILISVDPERDTPEQMALYVESNGFPDNLVGLTGALEDIKAVADSYFVSFRKVEQPESLAEYTIEHTSILFLMDEKGRFDSLIGAGEDPQVIADKLATFAKERGLTG